ncbi:MAG: ArsR family transcriptional regulator [Asgard group archaeon]|nr:ArsR family transcriptional regulator [Asgard group archaeon]
MVETENKTTNLDSFIDDLSGLIGAYANVSRLQIISSLKNDLHEFSELKEITQLSKTALAHHLEKLVKYGIIENTSRGKYKLTTDGFEIYSAILNSYVNSKRRIEIESKKRADHISSLYSQKKDEIDSLVVKFERLLPMRVVSFNSGLCESPENVAWEKLRNWAEPLGLLADPDKHPIYGFNNPGPKAGDSKYGYEFWIQVDSKFKSDDVEVKDIPEGFYVVSRCIVNDPSVDITNTWKKLIKWIERRGYKIAKGCGLEKQISSSHTGDFILDIYIPIVESSVTKNKK